MSNTYFKAMSVMGCEIGGITRRSLCRHNCCDGENCVTWLEKQFAKLNEYEEAKADGRLVMLPPPEESDYEGLKVKYRVYKAKDNTPVENCFVLRPEKDLAAVAALTAYAHATDNKQLAEDILNWITPDERVKVLPCKVGEMPKSNRRVYSDRN